VLWGTGDEELRTAVVAAHERAVASTLDFLQDHAAFTRRGAGGVFQVDTEGFVAASFLHRTSRAAEPQLHSHVLVANKVRAEDGRWLSLDGRELYEHQKAAGMLYRAALRAELTASLGVSWTPVDENGIAEIQGVPKVLVETWSTRRHEVESLGAELVASREAELGRELSGGERARCLQLAAYRSRAPKLDAETPTEVLVARWREEAASWGQAPEHWLPRVLGRALTSTPEDREAVVSVAIARLEETRATWGRSDVTEVLTTLVTGANADELRAGVEEAADEVIGDHRVCSLAAPLPAEPPDALRRRDGMSAIERHGATRYTTEATLRSEARVLDAVAKGRNVQVGLVPERSVDMVLSRSMLGADQQKAVRELLGGGEQVALLVGPAGAGKSRALGAAREAFEAAGYRPIGLAPSAIAARVLSDEAGLRSDTLARFLLDVENGRRSLGPRDVIVLDEATMTRTDDLERLITHTGQAGCKLVLVGDPHQLGCGRPGWAVRHPCWLTRRERARDGAPLHAGLGGPSLATAAGTRRERARRVRVARPRRRRARGTDAQRGVRALAPRARRGALGASLGRRQRDRRRAGETLPGEPRRARRGRARGRTYREREGGCRRRDRDLEERAQAQVGSR
jgi:conjugative relaxase-like TrwC/TraI family protein